MTTDNMIIFNEQTQTVATEVVAQSLAAFNEASGGALLLGSRSTLGDYIEEASYKAISGLVTRRDAYGTGDLTPLQIEQLNDISVKVDQSIGPVEWTVEQFARLLKTPEEAGLVIGEQAAEAMIQDYLNTAAASLVAAIGNQATLVNDYSATGTAKLVELNNTRGKFGDRQMSLTSWLMHSKVFTDLTNEAITNTSQLYNVGNIRVMQDGLGARYVVTDAPAFDNGDSTYNTVCLVAGGAMVETSALLTMTQPKADKENMGTIWKGESSFTIGLKGYSWDTANGGKSPNNSELATGTNWDLIASSTKDTAGVMLISQ